MIPSNNPTRDAYLNGTLDPEARRRIEAMAAQRMKPDLFAAATPPLTPTPTPETEAPRPIGGPAPSVRGLGAPPAMESSTASNAIAIPKPKSAAMEEYNRLRSSGSGISQIKSPFARIPLQIADAIGSTFLPALTMSLPGTELHHRILENRAAGAVNDEAKRDLQSAQADHARAEAGKITNPAAEYGTPIATDNGYVVPRKGSPTAEPLTVGGEQVQPADRSTVAPHYENINGQVYAFRLKPDGTYDKQLLAEVDPKLETSFQDVVVNGTVHRQLLNAQTGEMIRDLGETQADRATLTAVSLAVRAAGGDPANPASITPEIAKKANDIMRPVMPGVSLTPEAIQYWARAVSQGIPLPSLGMGNSGAAARQKILNAAPGASEGRSLVEARASQRADTESMKKLVTMRDSVSAFEKTASKNLDLFVRTAKPIVDSGSPWINTPLRMVGTSGMGSTDLAAYNAARQVALTEIAKVVNNPSLSSVLSDSARKEVMGLVPENATLGQIYAVANVLKQDMANRGAGLDDQIRQVQERMGGQGGGGNVPTVTTKEQYDALPSGAVFMEDGKQYRKP